LNGNEKMSIHPSEIEDCKGLIKENSYAVDDFIIEGNLSQKPYSKDIKQYLGEVLIKRTSTNISKSYVAGSQINWLSDFENDLKSKFYGV
jgi:hypothetical protein